MVEFRPDYHYKQYIICSDKRQYKTGLSELGADTSSMKDKPSEWKWGASSEYGWNPVYDFDNVKLDDNETLE